MAHLADFQPVLFSAEMMFIFVFVLSVIFGAILQCWSPFDFRFFIVFGRKCTNFRFRL